MIKARTIGMLDNAVINPVLTSTSEVANYTFLTVDGETYLVANTVNGDDSYFDDVTFAAGEYLNGYNLRPWVGQEIIADDKHIAYASGAKYSDLNDEDILTINADGKLAVASAAPSAGYYFVIVGKTRLVGNAVILAVKNAG